MTQSEEQPTIDDVMRIADSICTWGRWGTDDEIGTLNLLTPEVVYAASREVRQGVTISLALPIGSDGPQTGAYGRFNPVHVMLRDGGDAVTGATVQRMFGGVDKHLRGTDDLLLMPTQAGTHWDGLSHVIHGTVMYNNVPASEVSSFGAWRNGVEKAADRLVGRGVLLDLPRAIGVTSLEPAVPITPKMMDACLRDHSVEVHRGDILLVRTGHMASSREKGWLGYVGGPAPGMGLSALEWLADAEIAAVATDTWGFEVSPNETSDVFQPVHLVAVVYRGLWIGEMFDLEELAIRCARAGQYSFMLSSAPLPITGGVASPVNPVAIL